MSLAHKPHSACEGEDIGCPANTTNFSSYFNFKQCNGTSGHGGRAARLGLRRPPLKQSARAGKTGPLGQRRSAPARTREGVERASPTTLHPDAAAWVGRRRPSHMARSGRSPGVVYVPSACKIFQK